MRNKSFLVSQRYQHSKMAPCTSGAVLHKSVYQIYLSLKNLLSCQPLLRSWILLSSSNLYRKWTACLLSVVSAAPFFLLSRRIAICCFPDFFYIFPNFSFITIRFFDPFFEQFSIIFLKKEKRNL